MARNEPHMSKCLANGIAFVPTAGTRPAPEILVLELFREVFYKRFAMEKEQPLLPESEAKIAGPAGRLALEIVRGRRRLQRGQKAVPFYAPPYPEQAETAGLRRQADRVIRDHFLRGPIAEALKLKSGYMKELWADDVVLRLGGTNRAPHHEHGDLLWSLVKERPSPKELRTDDEAKLHLLELIERTPNECFVPEASNTDPLAHRIYHDFEVILGLEQDIARMQWIELLKVFLRFSTSIWLLSHMQVVVLLRGWLVDVVSGVAPPSEIEIKDKIRARSESLFHPILEPSSERMEHVSRYVKARIEAACLLNRIERFDVNGVLKKRLTVASASRDDCSIAQLAEFVWGCRDKVSSNEVTAVSAVIRDAEKYPGWYKPLKVGVGKNIDEFLRVLRRLSGDYFDQAYLESQEGIRADGRARIFPGPALIRLIVLLASRNAEARRNSSTNKLLLSDIERHFAQYGVDFSVAASSRPRMIENLMEQGLLNGSPDAGDSVEVRPPL